MAFSSNENPSQCLPMGNDLHRCNPYGITSPQARMRILPDMGGISQSNSQKTLLMTQTNTSPFPPFPCRGLIFSPAELAVMADLLCSRAEILQEMTDGLVASCAPGDDAWAITADQRDAAVSALNKVRNALLP